MSGANAWLLMCSIMIASLGLDKESPAIIIGAMLISPLMSPILGIGLSFGINDRRTLWISLRHFGIAIVIALVTSILYFAFTPLGEFNNEMAARTRPDTLDALVAIFGGLAGIISVSRKDKSSAIPGVAIATALMPPLCVAGFGIAAGQFQIFREALYLFFLNSFFIALSTYIIVKILKFDQVAFQDPKERQRTNLLMTILTVLFIVPSFFILNRVLGENKFKSSAKEFVLQHFEEQNLLSYEPLVLDSALIIRLLGTELSQDSLVQIQSRLNQLPNHKNTILRVVQEENPGTEELALLRTEFINVKSELDKLGNRRKTQAEKDAEIMAELQKKLSSFVPDTTNLDALTKECKIVVESLESIAIGTVGTLDQGKYVQIPTALVQWSPKLRPKEILESEAKLESYLRQRMTWDRVIISRF